MWDLKEVDVPRSPGISTLVPPLSQGWCLGPQLALGKLGQEAWETEQGRDPDFYSLGKGGAVTWTAGSEGVGPGAPEPSPNTPFA